MLKEKTFSFFRKNPLFLPAAIFALLIYSKMAQIPQKPYCALLPETSVLRLYGKALSTPTKIGGRKNSYRVRIMLHSVLSNDGKKSAATGIADVFIPSSLYEIYSPGKLYSAWRGEKNVFLIDAGANVEFEVFCKNGQSKNKEKKVEFFAEKIIRCEWDENSHGIKKIILKTKKIRALSRLHFARLMYAWGDAGGLVLALLSGSREYLAQNIRDAFKNAGLSHILALSGMHLSLFSGMAFFVGKKSFGKNAAPILQLFSILFFFWFAGKSPSLFRALLGSLCVIFASAFRINQKSPLNLLAFCFLLHVSIFPQDAFELAFIFSYGAVLGILCFNEVASKILCRFLPYKMGISFGQSCAAQIFTSPVSKVFLGKFSPPICIISSAVVSPIVTAYVYLALCAIVLCLIFPQLAPACGTIICAVYSVLAKCVLFFGR